jgi:type I restriction enzyme S subunit
MKLPRYPKYKDSGVEWLGDVPEHWTIQPLRYLINKIESGTSVNAIDDPAEADEFGVLKTSCVYSGSFDPTENKTVVANEVSRVSCPLRGGTLIVSRMNTPELVGATGLVKVAPENLFLPDRLWQVSFKDAVPAYIYYWSQSFLYRAHIRSVCSGTSSSMQNLGQDQYRAFVLATPPVPEQQATALFVDRETGKIDALVEEQRRLIELLKEKRQAVISHAVTKGLNPDAPMKDSGVDWLGEVPKHWSVMTVRRIASKVQTGGTPSSEPPTEDLEDGVPWLTPGDFGESLCLSDAAKRISTSVASSGEGKMLPEKSVFVVSIGATLGKVGYITQASSANQQINAIVPNDRIDGYFLAYSLSGKSEVMRFLSNASTIGIMNQEKTKEISLAIPPISEQSSISTFLDRETAKIDRLMAEATHAIDLLQERRTALISAAVTGTRAPSFKKRSRSVQACARAQSVPVADRRNSCIST